MNDVVKHATLYVLRAYKWAISPLFPPACRYVPTCSEYAMEAVDRYGALRGTAMAIARLLRCHPFSRGGYDPVVGQGQGQKSHSAKHHSTAFACGVDFAFGWRSASSAAIKTPPPMRLQPLRYFWRDEQPTTNDQRPTMPLRNS